MILFIFDQVKGCTGVSWSIIVVICEQIYSVLSRVLRIMFGVVSCPRKLYLPRGRASFVVAQSRHICRIGKVAPCLDLTNQRKDAKHCAGAATAFLTSTFFTLQTKNFAQENKCPQRSLDGLHVIIVRLSLLLIVNELMIGSKA